MTSCCEGPLGAVKALERPSYVGEEVLEDPHLHNNYRKILGRAKESTISPSRSVRHHHVFQEDFFNAGAERTNLADSRAIHNGRSISCKIKRGDIKHKHNAVLRTDITVARFIKGLAPAIGSKHTYKP